MSHIGQEFTRKNIISSNIPKIKELNSCQAGLALIEILGSGLLPKITSLQFHTYKISLHFTSISHLLSNLNRLNNNEWNYYLERPWSTIGG